MKKPTHEAEAPEGGGERGGLGMLVELVSPEGPAQLPLVHVHLAVREGPGVRFVFGRDTER